MTGLLLLKEHLKEFYNKYSYWIRFVVRLLLVLCTVLSMNANIGYMTKLKNPAVVLLLCVFGALLPDSASVFLMGCVMVAHVNGTDHIDDDTGSSSAVLRLQAGRQLAYGTYAPCVLV